MNLKTRENKKENEKIEIDEEKYQEALFGLSLGGLIVMIIGILIICYFTECVK